MPINATPTLEKLKTFKEQDDLGALRDAIEHAGAATTKKTLETREPALGLWLQVLNEIDAKLDPAFDPKDTPMMSIAPPPESGMPSGVDPAEIKNPAVAEKYRETLAQNQRKAARYLLQKNLRKLEARATFMTEAYLTETYKTSPEGKREALKVVHEKARAPHRKASLQMFVEKN